MRFSYAEPIPRRRDVMKAFKGLNRTLTVGDGEFSRMRNMTADFYPVLSPRQKRLKCHEFAKCNGIYGKDRLLWVDGTQLFYGGETEDGWMVADSEKTFVGMGAYVLIFPDKKVFHTIDRTLTAMEVSFSTVGNTAFTLCDAEGSDYLYESGTEPPPNPESGAYWLDESGENNSLKRYSAAAGEWVAISTTHVKLNATGIGGAFQRYDCVTVSGAADSRFNGDFVLAAAGDDYVVIPGVIEENFVQNYEASGAVTVARTVPDMAYFTECLNRVWGCSLDGHEIYACRQGDPYNWRAYEGLSTDSYAATVGTDGVFTGAATLLNGPVFFKENAIHRIMGTMPANFTLTVSDGPGVMEGSSRSLCTADGRLLYKTAEGVAAYDGTVPYDIAAALDAGAFHDAVAGRAGRKYYLSMKDEDSQSHLYVLDLKTGLWHEEDDVCAQWFASCQSDLFFVSGNVLWAVTRGGMALAFSGTEEGSLGDSPQAGEPLSWFAETGDILALLPDNKYVSGLQLRLQLEAGSRLEVYLMYDSSGEWEKQLAVTGGSVKRSFTAPIVPMRCDHFRMRLLGEGGAKVFSICKTMEEGSDL